MIKAVIFDLDGTLLDTLEDLVISTNYALNELKFPPRTTLEIKSFIGDGVQKLIERAIIKPAQKQKEELKISKETINNCLEIFKKHYSKNLYNNTRAYEGIIEVLKKLKENNIKIAVVSNKFDSAIKELTKKYFNNLVDIAIGQSEIIPKKPCPAGVLEVIKQLNVSLEETIFVGDSDVDIKTAKNAKIQSIGVLWGYRDKMALEGANYIITQPSEIFNIVLEP